MAHGKKYSFYKIVLKSHQKTPHKTENVSSPQSITTNSGEREESDFQSYRYNIQNIQFSTTTKNDEECKERKEYVPFTGEKEITRNCPCESSDIQLTRQIL